MTQALSLTTFKVAQTREIREARSQRAPSVSTLTVACLAASRRPLSILRRSSRQNVAMVGLDHSIQPVYAGISNNSTDDSLLLNKPR